MDFRLINTEQAVEKILLKRKQTPRRRSLLVGISGIDGSGKGHVTGRMLAQLQQHKVASINVDGWLNLPHRRFNPENPAQHFYENALRMDEMFSQLILPLRASRRCDLAADFAEETATRYRVHRYVFNDIDIILLEGIYLFKRAYRHHFDLAFWIDCSFDTAIERALERRQEGLPADETIHAYRTIYFPAQQIHFDRDRPRASADFIINNDSRLAI
ncbi:MAG: uridine kinase [Acidobacteriota bacterium]